MLVYDKKTGEPLECEAVDAKELLASGSYVKQEEDKPKKTRKAKLKDEAETE